MPRTKSLMIAIMARKLVRQPRPAVAAKTRSLLEREVIARSVFTSVQDLSRKLMRYIRAYSKTALQMELLVRYYINGCYTNVVVPIAWFSNVRKRILPCQ